MKESIKPSVRDFYKSFFKGRCIIFRNKTLKMLNIVVTVKIKLSHYHVLFLCMNEAFLPEAWCLLKYLLPSFFKQLHSFVRLIQQVSHMHPQVLGLVSPGHLAICRSETSVGLPNLHEQRRCLRHQIWQVWWTVSQAQPRVSAQLVEPFQSFERLVNQPPVSTGRGLGGHWTCCCHDFEAF